MYSNGKITQSLIVGMFCAIGINAYGQEIRQDTLLQVTVTERSRSDPLRLSTTTTTPVQTITGKAMTQLGITDVSGALKMMSGLEVKDYGGMGGMKSISIRHLGAQHTAVLYDGVPVSNCQAGQIDVSRFATDEYTKVSLTIGMTQNMLVPASVEPYSGQIDIVNTEVRNSASVSWSNWNTWDLKSSLRIGQLSGKVSYRHTDGNYPFTLTNVNQKTREVRSNDRYDAVTVQVGHRKAWDAGGDIRTQLYYHHSNQGLPGGIILYNTDSHQKMKDHNLLIQNRGEWLLNDRLTLVTIAKYNLSTTWYDDGNRTANNSPDGYGRVYRYEQHEGYLSAALQYRVRCLALSVVDDVAVNTLWSDIKQNPNPVRWSNNLAVRGRFTIPLWNRDSQDRIELLTSCVLTTTTDLHTDTPSRNYVLPNVSLGIPLWNGLRLRASWRKALRMPSFNDLYYYQIGNHSLRPELSQQWNVGVSYDDDYDRRLRFSAAIDVYHYDVTDKIIAFPTPFAWKMVNMGDEKINGLNASLSAFYQITRHVGLAMSGSYNYQNVNLPYSPQNTGAFAATLQSRWIDIGYRLQISGERYSKLDHSWRYRLNAFTEHSLTLSKELGINKQSDRYIKFNFSIINLTNQQYEIIQYYPMPGCHCRIGISVHF